jgi:tetratricopeptide (TPR) repeat protein
MLDGDVARSTGTVMMVVGPAGIGKTALAVHFAHQIRTRFPDGQLYVNLRGHDPERPVTPEQALDEFLPALGIPREKIPVGVDARAELYQSLLGGRRVLILLDNANAVEQVNPLLPDSPSCAVIMTSRGRLTGGGIPTVPVGRLDPAEAVALLREQVGARVDAEPDAAAELARLCDGVPLALRIAARRVAAGPELALVELADELTGERGNGAAGIGTAFRWSYHSLPPEAARLFRLLGLHQGPDFSASGTAALAGHPPTQVRQLLNLLAGGHLLEEIGPDRYRFHDQLRLYATAYAGEVPEAERAAAVERELTWYLYTADAAGRALSPIGLPVPLEPHEPDESVQPLAFDTREEALAWFVAERANLVAATDHAAQCGQHVIAWKLPAVLWDYFAMHGHFTDWITTHNVGLAAARQLGDRHGEAWTENNLGNAYRRLGQLDEALGHFHNALASNEAIGNRRGEGWTRYNIGDTLRELGRFEEALEHLRRALVIGREVGERFSEGYTLNVIGDCYRCMGRFEEALRHLMPALVINRELGHRRGEGFTLTMIGDTHQERGRLRQALTYYQAALEVRRGIGDRRGEGETLHSLGDNCYKQKQLDRAYEHYQQSLVIRHELGDRRAAARTLSSLGTVQVDLGRLDEARESWQQALVIFEELGDPQATQVRDRLDAFDG